MTTIELSTPRRALDSQPIREIAARAVNLTKIYGRDQTQVVACDRINLDLPKGEFTAIMGPSGSGKSTLMHCMAGLDTLSSGQTFIGDAQLGGLNDRQLTRLRRDRVGFIFQAFNLVPTLTAAENIVLPLAIAGRKADPTWYRTVVQTLGLEDRLGHKPAQLSGGQQQRVACARSLVARPDIVFADEPTGNLDSTASREVLQFLRTSVDQFGQTIVMVTHDPGAAAVADRVVFLADGRLVTEIAKPDRDTVLTTMAKLQTGARPGGPLPAATNPALR